MTNDDRNNRADVARRIAAMSPERRQALTRLLAREARGVRAGASSGAAAAGQVAPPM